MKISLKHNVNLAQERMWELSSQTRKAVLGVHKEKTLNYRDKVRSHAQNPASSTPSPGSEPRKLSGDYWRSIQTGVVKRTNDYMETEVGSDAAQAHRLEFGGTSGNAFGKGYTVRTHPHPHWLPGFYEALGPEGELMAKDMQKALVKVAQGMRATGGLPR